MINIPFVSKRISVKTPYFFSEYDLFCIKYLRFLTFMCLILKFTYIIINSRYFKYPPNNLPVSGKSTKHVLQKMQCFFNSSAALLNFAYGKNAFSLNISERRYEAKTINNIVVLKHVQKPVLSIKFRKE